MTLRTKTLMLDPHGYLLIVEDNIVNQQIARHMLEARGYRADIVANGREAITALERRSYAAILMDCQMPELDGYEATAEIRRREGSTRHTPIIALSAHVLAGEREKCLAAGMDDYLAKPIVPKALDAVLERWVPRAAPPLPRSSEDSSITSEPALDQTVFANLRNLQTQTSKDILPQVIDLFVQSTTSKLASLREALAAGNLESVSQIAHNLRGSSAITGARHMARLCKDLEALGAGGDPARAADLLIQIETAFEHVRVAFDIEMARG